MTTTSTLAETTDRLAAGCPLTGWGGQGDPTRCRWCNRWMGTHPTALFCHPACSHLFWANHSWKKAKEEAKRRAGRRCERCGEPGGATGGVHHKGGVVEGGRDRAAGCGHHQAELVYLCAGCHRTEHHPPAPR